MVVYEFLHVGIAVVHHYILVQGGKRPRLVGIDRLVYLEEDIEYRDEHHEGKHVHPLREEVEHDRPYEIHLVRFQVPRHDL